VIDVNKVNLSFSLFINGLTICALLDSSANGATPHMRKTKSRHAMKAMANCEIQLLAGV
jgi:hypothetical protein